MTQALDIVKRVQCFTLAEVIATTKCSRSEVYRRMDRPADDNPFPPGIGRGGRRVWRAETVLKWLEEEERRSAKQWRARAG